MSVIQIVKRLTVTAASYKWAAIAPKDLGITAIRALVFPKEDESDELIYMSFTGIHFELESPTAGVSGYRVDIRKGQAVDLRKVNAVLSKIDPSAPKVRQDHILYLVAGIRSPGM